MNDLEYFVKQEEALGCTRCSLGIVYMPEGYALMLDQDQMYYYWLRKDGITSFIHWNRWAVYQSAKQDSSTHVELNYGRGN